MNSVDITVCWKWIKYWRIFEAELMDIQTNKYTLASEEGDSHTKNIEVAVHHEYLMWMNLYKAVWKIVPKYHHAYFSWDKTSENPSLHFYLTKKERKTPVNEVHETNFFFLWKIFTPCPLIQKE